MSTDVAIAMAPAERACVLRAMKTTRFGMLITVLMALVALAGPCLLNASTAFAMPMQPARCTEPPDGRWCLQQSPASNHSLTATSAANIDSAATFSQVESPSATLDPALLEPEAPRASAVHVQDSTPLRI